MADAFTPLGFTKIEVGASSATWGQKTNVNWDLADTKISANTTALAAATATANAALPKAGGVATGSITAPAFVLDNAGYLVLSGTTPVLNYDANDYVAYDRASNTLNTVINGAVRFAVNPTDTIVVNNLVLSQGATAASHATRKDYVDAAVAGRLPLSGGNISGDVVIYRPGAPTTGVLYLGNQGRYLFNDGTNFTLSGGDLYVNGYRAWTTQTFDANAKANVGGATFTGTLRSTAQIISQAPGNATVCAYDYTQGFCVGIMAGAGNGLYFTNNDGNGNYAGSWRGMFDPSGNFTAQGNVSAYSDARKKANVRTIGNALQIVNGLRGVRYTRTDQEDRAKLHVGLIAQEVRDYLPEVVGEVEGFLTVDYSSIVSVLVEAIKDLTNRIADIEDEIG